MPDIVGPEERSRIMAQVRSTGTSAEMRMRRALDEAGLSYETNASDLPGKPDIVFRAHRLAIFVHGCFWHGHGCKRGARIPATNTEYWTSKIQRNVRRDAQHLADLESMGWRVIVIWECGIAARVERLLAELQPLEEAKLVARVLDNQKVRALREQRGLSQSQLAEKVRVSRRAVKSWEQDRTPFGPLLARLAEALGVDLDDLLSQENE